MIIGGQLIRPAPEQIGRRCERLVQTFDSILLCALTAEHCAVHGCQLSNVCQTVVCHLKTLFDLETLVFRNRPRGWHTRVVHAHMALCKRVVVLIPFLAGA